MRKVFTVLAALIVPTAALGQQPAQYTLTVTPQDVQVIGNALGSRPFAEVRDLFQRLEAQVTLQNQPKVRPQASSAEPTKPTVE